MPDITPVPREGEGRASREGAPLRSALFVDFDNVYLTLQASDPRTAEVFATDPVSWMSWLERGFSGQEQAGGERVRAILLRRCYLNPASFRRYRSDFIRSGFRVVDCPSLTRAGKNSTDIYMVMDIIDALAHPTRFEEVIIFSGDADFTPVLLRLREHDRRTAILAVGPAAAAYKAAADQVIDEHAFVEHGLGLQHAPGMFSTELVSRHVQLPPGAPLDLLHRMGASMHEAISAHGPLLATDLPGIYKRFPDFPKSNWLGFFSLRLLTQQVIGLRDDLRITEGDPWRVDLRSVGHAHDSTPLSTVARSMAEASASELPPAVSRRIHHITGTPPLSAAEYASVFEAIAEEIAAGRYDLVTTAKGARERCIERGHAIPRAHVTFILQTLAHAGHPLEGSRTSGPRELAEAFRGTITAACESAEVDLSAAEIEELEQWIVSLAPESVSLAPESVSLAPEAKEPLV